MIRIAKRIILLAFFLIGIFVSKAQNTDLKGVILNDTTLSGIHYYYFDKHSYLIDTLYGVNYDVFMTHYYDNSRIPNEHFYQGLSTLGSDSKDLIFHLDNIFDYKRQTNTFLPYIFTPSNVKYFQNRKAYTHLTYSNSLSGRQYFNVNFAKNLYKRLNLQLGYLVNYADGEFDNSQVMNQFFNTSLNYVSPKGRYYVTLAFVHNRAYVLQNGGIENDSVFRSKEYSSLGSYPVNLEQGWSKWKTSDYTFNQSFRLSKDTNNANKIFNAGAIVHSFTFSRYTRLYNDENKTIKDSLGENIARNSLFWTNDIYSKKSEIFIPISIGMNIDYLDFNDSLYNSSFMLYSPEFNLGLRTKNFLYKFSGAYTFSSSDYDGNGFWDMYLQMNLSKQKNIFVFADLLYQDKQADYIFSHYLTEQYAWDNDLDKTKSTKISIGASFFDNFSIEARFFDVKKLYFFDSDLNLHTTDSKIFQTLLKNDMLLGKFRLKGTYALQYTEDKDYRLHLPLFLLRQTVDYSFTMFMGKLHSNVGIDLNYYTKYSADAYNPQTGMFVWQNNEKIGNYLYADAYMNINIDRFCLFIMLQHPYAGLINHDYFSTPLYPAEGFTFRYGFTWKLVG